MLYPIGLVQQTSPFSEWNQKIFTHPNLQVTRKYKYCDARITGVVASQKNCCHSYKKDAFVH